MWRELSWYGAHMAYKEEEAGLSGALNDAEYSGWGHFGFHWTPVRPYDMATDTMFEFMGVRVDPVDQPVTGDLQKLTGPVPSLGKVAQNGIGCAFEGRLNDSFKALNLLFDKGVAVRRIDKAAPGLRPGDFVVAPVRRHHSARRFHRDDHR